MYSEVDLHCDWNLLILFIIGLTVCLICGICVVYKCIPEIDVIKAVKHDTDYIYKQCVGFLPGVIIYT